MSGTACFLLTPPKYDGDTEEKFCFCHLTLPNTHTSTHMKHSVFSQSCEQSTAFSLLNGRLQVRHRGGIEQSELPSWYSMGAAEKKGEGPSLGISAVWGSALHIVCHSRLSKMEQEPVFRQSKSTWELINPALWQGHLRTHFLCTSSYSPPLCSHVEMRLLK